MILSELTLHNFRQFRGSHRVCFARGDNGRNVTVIYGQNGRGKTSLFRALVFCLFGERQLSQDGETATSEIRLINSSALEASEGRPVEMSVSLGFTHAGSSYALRRTMRGLLEGERVVEELGEIRLSVTTGEGNTKFIDTDSVDRTVATILDRRVKEYFLFDGEKIERLTRATAEHRREVSLGIRNLLNVDSLDSAIRTLGGLVKVLDEQLAKVAPDELMRLLTRLRDNEQTRESTEQRLNEIESELLLALKEIETADAELEAFNEVKILIEKRRALESELSRVEARAVEQLQAMRSFSCEAGCLIASSIINSIFGSIERQKQKGEIPSEIRRDLIERILSEGTCICGNSVKEGTEPYGRIVEWRTRTSDTATQDIALNLWRFLSDVQNRLVDDYARIQNALISYGNTRNDIERVRNDLGFLKGQIGSAAGRRDAAHLESHRTLLQNKHVSLEAERQIRSQELEQLQSEHTRLSAQLNEEKLKSTRHEELFKRSTLSRASRDALAGIRDQFREEIRSIIGDGASVLFLSLLDRQGQLGFRRVLVGEDYSLQVLDRWNRPTLANISAGQRQLMSIAFLAALAQVAATDGVLEMPWFMDTPFGRLSSEHRVNLLRKIPEIASQWILLATDTEFRREEARLLRSGGRWGRFYKLSADSEGNTTVEEFGTDVAQAILEDEAS